MNPSLKLAACRRNAPSFRRFAAALPILLVLLLCGSPVAWSQAYTSIVVFGDSLSDVGNDAALSYKQYGFSAQVPGPLTGYTSGRFTDGTDTVPAARNYNGVWIEQLAAQLTAHPPVTSSYSGGRNYAYGYATTNSGTSVLSYGPNNAASITVENMGQQLVDYLSTTPTINSSTLFVVWGGANDLLKATSSADIVTIATREVALVQRLVTAGATDIIVPNLPPLGLIPRLNGNAAASAQATAAAQAFNQALAAGLAQVTPASAGAALHLYPLDVYTLFNTVVGPPLATGFTNVTTSSQFASVNPDTYLFWDDLHPTTYGHSLIAAAALRLLAPVATTTSVSLSASASSINVGSSVTLTANVSASTGTPVGTVTFLDGTTVLGSKLVSGSTTTATATFTTTSLAAGSHILTASFAGVNGYGNATSSSTTVTVVAPSYAASLAPASLTVARGATGTSVLTLAPTGGYTGSFTVACGTVAKISCSVATGTVAITSSASGTTTITVGTLNTVANRAPALPGMPVTQRVEYALLGLSVLSGLSLGRKRSRRLRSLPLLLLPALLSLAVVAGITGCGGDAMSHDTPAGTYAVPVTVTPTTGAATTVTLNVTVQ
ncbi:MAG: SGNH/GDSL hydrolase family protein [Janthinobacterium lividum]